jgi:thiosulfate/3-mercaptopyruvate sulfurtransferase
MARSDVLVDGDYVEAHDGDPGVVLVEVDEDTIAYDKGHLRNAIKIDWKRDLQHPVRRDFVNADGFEALLSARAISNGDTVILYGGNNNLFAAYAYWYFTLYQPGSVKLRDGGRKKRELDSRELATDVVRRPATSYSAHSQDTSIRRSATRCWPRSAGATWSMSAPRMSSPGACLPRHTCRRSRRSAPGTSRPR